MRRPSVIAYIGGKYDQAPWIVSHFPHGYKNMAYVEPFCGSLAVFLAKGRSRVELINDKDAEIMNLWWVIQKQREELAAAADKLPYARKLYEEWATPWFKGDRPDDPFERALHFFYIARSGFAGKVHEKSGFGYAVDRNHAKSYRVAIASVRQVGERLKYAQIECRDFRGVFQSGDAPNSLIYCDPPFIGMERYYTEKFTEEDHRELAALAGVALGRVLISYYDHPLVRELYPPDRWHYHLRDTVRSAEGIVRGKRNTGLIKEPVRELLLTNYEEQLTLL